MSQSRKGNFYPKDNEESWKSFLQLSHKMRFTFEKDHSSCKVNSELKEARLEARRSLGTHLFTYTFFKDQKDQKVENVQCW